jgi:glycosyltransferase involved in cell wall biosynthesis
LSASHPAGIIKVKLKIVTKIEWPSFANTALLIKKALSKRCSCTIHDQTKVRPGGNILFLGTVYHQTLNSLEPFIGNSQVVFYGTTEGHSYIDETSLKIAEQIKVVAVSNFVRQMLIEIGISAVDVVHHGLDMSSRKVDVKFYEDLKRKLGNKKIVLTVSANHSRKGLDNLLTAYAGIEQETENSYLVLHSEPTGYYNLPKMAKKLKLKHFWLTNQFGKLNQNRLNALYKLCDVYVQPSYSEGFGLTMLEAFRFNKPVIAADAPPFNEVVKHGKNGILVPTTKTEWQNFTDTVLFKLHMYEPQDLASAITELLANPNEITKMQETIRKEKHNWSIHRLYPRLLHHFTSNS